MFYFRNWYATDAPGDPDLSNVILPVPPGDAPRLIEAVAATLPRWRVEQIEPDAGRVHLTRRTRLFGFVDDIHLTLEPAPSGTRLRGRSQSRVGLSDLGQNRRNLKQLIAALHLGHPGGFRPSIR